MIAANLIDAIIGLPDNLFMNTDIPVLLMILKKNQSLDDILMVDASKEFEKHGKVNAVGGKPRAVNLFKSGAADFRLLLRLDLQQSNASLQPDDEGQSA